MPPREPAPPLAGTYELRQASVVLDGRTPALDHLQLTVAARQHVALVGTAGSGKSTLTLALAKLTGFTGTILLDGTDLTQVPAARAGRAIGFVPADARLFTGSIFDNLLYGLQAPAGRRREDRPGPGERGLARSLPSDVSDRAGLVAVALEVARLVGLEDDLFGSASVPGSTSTRHPEVAARILATRQLVAERFAREQQRDRRRVLRPGALLVLRVDRREHPSATAHTRRWRSSNSPSTRIFARCSPTWSWRARWSSLAPTWARDMVEIFKDIAADNELFARSACSRRASCRSTRRWWRGSGGCPSRPADRRPRPADPPGAAADSRPPPAGPDRR